MVFRGMPFCSFCMVHHDPCEESVKDYELYVAKYQDDETTLFEWGRAERTIMKIEPKFEAVPTVDLRYC